MKKISLLFIPVMIFTGLVIFQVNAHAEEDAVNEAVVTEAVANENVENVAVTNEAAPSENRGARTFQSGNKIFMSSATKIRLADTDNIQTNTVFYRINDGADQEYTEPFSIEEEGTHTVVYYAVDRLGNREVPQIITIVIDNTPPDVTLNIMAPFVIVDDMVFASEFFNYQYSMTAQDNLSGIASLRYSIGDADDAPQQQYLRPFLISSPTPVKVNVFAEDRVGNATTQFTTNIYDENGTLIASADDIVITVDNTPPMVTITPDQDFFMKDDLQAASRDYKFTISATDEESGVRAIYYRLNNDEEFTLYIGQEISFANNGMHRIEAIAIDRVGNTSAGTILEFYVDTVAPVTELKFGAAE